LPSRFYHRPVIGLNGARGEMTSNASVPRLMRAAWIDRLGPAENIRYREIPVPAAGPSDVLVRVAAVAVNAVDTFVRSGAYRTLTPFPFVIGRDLVGDVAAVGSPAIGFMPGEKVWCNSMGHGGRQGAAAEYAAVPADRLYRLPDGVNADEAVAILHPAVTAHLALHTHGGLQAGETIYIAGGAGNVGAAAIVLAAHAGARVLTSARAEDVGYCHSLGAAVALDYKAVDLARALREAAADGVSIYLDTSGVNDMALAVDLLATRGRIVLMSGLGARPQLPVGPLYTRDGRIVGFVISNASVPELADAREIDALPLAAAAEAHRRLESGQLRGRRLVLRP
jgi:NADPH:quinone reductase-like Zn-dependent oxidoreductase